MTIRNFTQEKMELNKQIANDLLDIVHMIEKKEVSIDEVCSYIRRKEFKYRQEAFKQAKILGRQ